MRRGSGKPCPGCGEVEDYRRADEVCGECAENLSFAKEVKAAQAARALDSVYQYWLTESAHCIKLGCYISSEVNRPIVEALHEMARSYHMPEIDDAPFAPGENHDLFPSDHYGSPMRLTMRESDAERLRALARLFGDSLKHAREKGRMDGENFIARIADGRISATDLNAHLGIGGK